MLSILLFLFYLIVACLITYYLRDRVGVPWWVKVVVQSPACTYYFGPFDSFKEAQSQQSGYIQDLKEEGATEVVSQIQQCQPEQLTICEEDYS